MKRTRQKRKSQAQWQAIIEQYQASDVSGTQFCQAHDIAYGSFCKWRQRLLPQTRSPVEGDGITSLAPFIDVSALTHSAEKPWHIILKLGNGIELCLSQA